MLTSDQIQKIQEIEQILLNPSQELYSNPTKLKTLNAELNHLKNIEQISNRITEIEKQISENKELINSSDTELSQVAKEEIERLNLELTQKQTELEELERPHDPKDFGDCIIEIRAGTGGEEAALFAADLYRMYSKFCIIKDFQIELLDRSDAGAGGLKEIIFKIIGENAFGTFKSESGVHRVQRIPKTESAGRIHTSAASVVVLPIVETSEIEIKDQDLRIDVYRSSGAGGQGVNTTDSAVRITHMPTGIVVTCQDSRSQIKNKDSAMSVLRSKLYELEIEKSAGNITDIRKSSIKTGDRSDKIKTYNFPQNRLTDHRSKKSWYNLDSIMEGQLGEVMKN